MTSLDLTDEEAELFLAIRRHQELFKALIEAQVPEIRRGEAVLSFNHDGHLMHVEIKRIAYRKK